MPVRKPRLAVAGIIAAAAIAVPGAALASGLSTASGKPGPSPTASAPATSKSPAPGLSPTGTKSPAPNPSAAASKSAAAQSPQAGIEAERLVTALATLADPQAPGLVRAAREQAGELDELITDLLDLARYRESAPHRETVRLDLLAEQAVHRLRRRAPQAAIDTELSPCLAQASEGSVDVRTGPDGSTFTLAFPEVSCPLNSER